MSLEFPRFYAHKVSLNECHREVGPLAELLRQGAQQLIHQVVEADLEALLAQHCGRRTEAGTAGIVRNDFLPDREL